MTSTICIQTNSVKEVCACNRSQRLLLQEPLIGISELATLLQKEREKVSPDAQLLVTVNGDFLSGSMLAVACKGYEQQEIRVFF